MRKPIVINTSVPDKQGNENIVAQVIDIHYTNILRIVSLLDGHCLLYMRDLGDCLKVLVPFQEMYKLYKDQNFIDDRYKDIVDTYLKDNYSEFRQNLDNYGETN